MDEQLEFMIWLGVLAPMQVWSCGYCSYVGEPDNSYDGWDRCPWCQGC